MSKYTKPKYEKVRNYIKEETIEKQQKSSEEIKESKNPISELYYLIIKGFILFREDFKDLIFEHDLIYNVLNVNNMNKSTKLINYFNWFNRYNQNAIVELINNDISEVNFKNQCFKKEKRFSDDIFETPQVNYDELYDLFVQTVFMFDYKEEVFYISELIDLLELYNFKPYRTNSLVSLNEVWSVFLKLNEKSNTHRQYQNNKELFSGRVYSYFKDKKTYELINDVNKVNYHYYINQIFSNEDINKQLKDNSIVKVIDLTDLNLDEFIDVFDTSAKIDEIEQIVNVLKKDLKDVIHRYYIKPVLDDKNYDILMK